MKSETSPRGDKNKCRPNSSHLFYCFGVQVSVQIRQRLHQPGPSYTNKPSIQTGFPWGLRRDLSRRRICWRDEAFISPHISFCDFTVSPISLSCSPHDCSLSLFLSPLVFILNRQKRVSWAVGIQLQWREEEKRWRRRKRKKSGAVTLLYTSVCWTGKTPWITSVSTQPITKRPQHMQPPPPIMWLY